MTNRQWLLEKMQNMSDEELARFFTGSEIICDFQEPCPCDVKEITCIECRSNWLKSEHKEPIKLSDAERVILENVDKKYVFIARNSKNGLLIFTKTPIKREDFWLNTDNTTYSLNLEPFNHLFQFITWNDSEPYNIEELLKCGC